MRIKFLSFIASFFLVSLVITSCLDDDNNIEYSPDATIHAFALDTAGYGNYKFTIDQLQGLIYNEDSLPVHVDTIIDKIKITTLTTASGIVTMKDKNDKDSIININDSIDLRNPLKIKVWSTEALAGISPDQTKEYTITVRVHKHDPDSLSWGYVGNMPKEIKSEQKTVILGNKILTYSIVNNVLTLYSSQKGNSMSWTSEPLATAPFNNTLPTSIIPYKEKLYATTEGDNTVYESTDGIAWTKSSLFPEGQVALLLAPLKNRITFIKIDNEKKVFDSTAEIVSRTGEKKTLQAVPDDFPTGNISYTSYSTSTEKEAIMLIGTYKEQPTIGTTKTIVPWVFMGEIWVSLAPNNVDTSCPALVNPSLMYYNDQFYIFGDGFDSFYTSSGGIAWRKANNKFSFPNQDWSIENFKPSIEKPEFRGRANYSMVLDEEESFIYILFREEENVTFTEEVEKVEETRATEPIDRGPYRHDPEVWRGRLNQLWFDFANAGK